MASNADAERLAKRFAAIPAAVRRAVKPAIDKGAEELVARMQFLAPDEQGTGALRQSIVKKPGPTELSATVSAGGPATTDAKGFDHALGQEYGTQTMRARPYFWVSVRSLSRRVHGRVDRAISKAVKLNG